MEAAVVIEPKVMMVIEVEPEVKVKLKLELELKVKRKISEYVFEMQVSSLPQFRYNSLSKSYHLFVNILVKYY